MATTFTWAISELERETSDGFVFTVHYTIDAADDVYSAGAYGSIGLERPETDLIPFDSLTEEICVQWVKDKLGDEKIAEVEAVLQGQINEKRSPTKAAGKPW